MTAEYPLWDSSGLTEQQRQAVLDYDRRFRERIPAREAERAADLEQLRAARGLPDQQTTVAPCGCKQGPGRQITDPERHAAWHATFCAVCRQRMAAVERGQSTHPCCDPNPAPEVADPPPPSPPILAVTVDDQLDAECPCGASHQVLDVGLRTGRHWLCWRCRERRVPQMHAALWHFEREADFLAGDRFADREGIYDDTLRLLDPDGRGAGTTVTAGHLHDAGSLICLRRIEGSEHAAVEVALLEQQVAR